MKGEAGCLLNPSAKPTDVEFWVPGEKNGTRHFSVRGNGVIDGARTRNNQNHNLGLYH
jgi:hypothetical protein